MSRPGAKIDQKLVDKLTVDFPQLSDSTIKSVVERTESQARPARAALERIVQAAAALKKKYPGFPYPVIVRALEEHDFKLKKTAKHLHQRRHMAMLHKKYPQVSKEVLISVYRGAENDYARADAELAHLIRTLEAQRKRGEVPKARTLRSANAGSAKSARGKAATLDKQTQAKPAPPPPASTELVWLAEPDDDVALAAGESSEAVDLAALDALLSDEPAGDGEARALYDYAPDKPEKLPFRKGDLVLVSDTSSSNWWRGSSGGREGKFPKTYVRLLSEEIRATALHSFEDSSRDTHIRLRKGDSVIILNKIAGSEWWEVLNPISKRVGIAPANYLRVDSNIELFDELNQVQ